MTPTVYMNGAFVPRDEASVSITDGGWLHGAGLFETIRAEYGRIFRLRQHLERLRNSAAALLRPIERADLPGDDVFAELLERNGQSKARLRLTVTAAGMLDRPATGSDDIYPLNIALTATELDGYPDSMYANGIHVVVCDFRQAKSDPLAGHKTTAYLPRLLGLRQAQQAQCPETLWFNVHNQLAEGSISNVFLVSGGTIKTPPLDTPVLPGIARAVVIELARAAKIPLQETPLTLDDLFSADEVFLTNVIMQVMPVIRVEKHDVRDSKVGPVAKKMREAFHELVRKECRP